MMKALVCSSHPEPGTLNVEPILTKFVRERQAYTLDFYLQHAGYAGLRKGLAIANEEHDLDRRLSELTSQAHQRMGLAGG